MRDSKNHLRPVEEKATTRKQLKKRLQEKPVEKHRKSEDEYQNLANFIMHGRVKD